MSSTTLACPADRQESLVIGSEPQDFSLSIRLYDNFEQIVDFRMPGVAILGLDESRPSGRGWGPSPAHLIAAAVGACLGGRLLARLRERKIEVRDLRTDVTGNFQRDANGTRRIARISVRLVPGVESPTKIVMPTPQELIRESMVAKSIGPGIVIELSITPDAPPRARCASTVPVSHEGAGIGLAARGESNRCASLDGGRLAPAASSGEHRYWPEQMRGRFGA